MFLIFIFSELSFNIFFSLTQKLVPYFYPHGNDGCAIFGSMRQISRVCKGLVPAMTKIGRRAAWLRGAWQGVIGPWAGSGPQAVLKKEEKGFLSVVHTAA